MAKDRQNAPTLASVKRTRRGMIAIAATQKHGLFPSHVGTRLYRKCHFGEPRLMVGISWRPFGQALKYREEIT